MSLRAPAKLRDQGNKTQAAAFPSAICAAARLTQVLTPHLACYSAIN